MGRRISLDRTILLIVEMVSQRLVLSPLAILLRPGVQKTLEMKKGESILSDSAQGEHQERLLRHIGCIVSFCPTYLLVSA